MKISQEGNHLNNWGWQKPLEGSRKASCAEDQHDASDDEDVWAQGQG